MQGTFVFGRSCRRGPNPYKPGAFDLIAGWGRFWIYVKRPSFSFGVVRPAKRGASPDLRRSGVTPTRNAKHQERESTMKAILNPVALIFVGCLLGSGCGAVDEQNNEGLEGEGEEASTDEIANEEASTDDIKVTSSAVKAKFTWQKLEPFKRYTGSRRELGVYAPEWEGRSCSPGSASIGKHKTAWEFVCPMTTWGRFCMGLASPIYRGQLICRAS